jgi:hypothetical protein
MRNDPGWYYSASRVLDDLVVKQPLQKRRQDDFTRFLLAHGCSVEETEKYCAVRLPEGTLYCVRLPSLPTERYRFDLPDGASLYGHDLSRMAGYESGMKELYPAVADLEAFLRMQITDPRPSFQSVRERSGLTRVQIAQAAQMSLERVAQLEETGQGTEGEIIQLVAALNHLTHARYELVTFSGFISTDQSIVLSTVQNHAGRAFTRRTHGSPSLHDHE